MKNCKIVITGGTGYIGRYLATLFAKENEVVILTRNVDDSNNNAFAKFEATDQSSIRLVDWNAKDEGEWEKELDGCQLVINLAGKSVNCRYTAKNKQEIFDSRTNATKAIGKAIAKATQPPKLWINSASATIYRHATDRPQDELNGEMHDDFSVQVCKLWEKTFFEQRVPFTRKVAMRLAITLGPGGVMVPYFNLLKFGLGGQQGNGKQMYSWVHIHDVYRSIVFFYENKELEGVYNVCSPNPVTNAGFMQTLRKVTDHKIGLPAFKWMLELGAPVIGTETELVLKSRWVVPTKLTEAGFTFQFAELKDAIADIVCQVPRKKYHLF